MLFDVLRKVENLFNNLLQIKKNNKILLTVLKSVKKNGSCS